jgi:hypothetical protein
MYLTGDLQKSFYCWTGSVPNSSQYIVLCSFHASQVLCEGCAVHVPIVLQLQLPSSECKLASSAIPYGVLLATEHGCPLQIPDRTRINALRRRPRNSVSAYTMSHSTSDALKHTESQMQGNYKHSNEEGRLEPRKFARCRCDTYRTRFCSG